MGPPNVRFTPNNGRWAGHYGVVYEYTLPKFGAPIAATPLLRQRILSAGPARGALAWMKPITTFQPA
jgi:hypothetical protein